MRVYNVTLYQLFFIMLCAQQENSVAAIGLPDGGIEIRPFDNDGKDSPEYNVFIHQSDLPTEKRLDEFLSLHRDLYDLGQANCVSHFSHVFGYCPNCGLVYNGDNSECPECKFSYQWHRTLRIAVATLANMKHAAVLLKDELHLSDGSDIPERDSVPIVSPGSSDIERETVELLFTMYDYVIMDSTWIQLFPKYEHKIMAQNFGGAFDILPIYPSLETL